jgi:flavin reductase
MKAEFAADRSTYREAMSRLGAAVNIITTCNEDGDSGFTASAVCAVTDDPPTLLVCMNRNSSQNDLFKQAGMLCVNVLTRDDQALSPLFAGVGDVPMAERFARAAWERLVTGAPALISAAASFDCTIDQITEVGTHSVFFCGVRAIRLGERNAGLIYHGRAYHAVGEAAL